MPYNPLPIEGKQHQIREMMYNRIIAAFPEKANSPDLLYGDIEALYYEYLNAGLLPADDKGVKNLLKTGTETYAALNATYEHIGSTNADTQTGATVAAKITNASFAANNVYGIVTVPSTLSTAINTNTKVSDLNVADGRLVIDYRNEVGTISNFAQRGAAQYTKIFGANKVVPPVENSDNGSVVAIEAVLTEGTGGNSTGVIHGENVALYTGIVRQAASTRSAWGANVLLTSHANPSPNYHSMGLEIDVNNNSNTDATATDIFDGLSVFTAGTSDARFGIWVTSGRSNGAGVGTASRWVDGIHISGVCSRAALSIDAGQASFDSANMIGITCQPPAIFDSYVKVGSLELTNAQYDALPDYGAHVWRSEIPGQGKKTTGQLEANGKLTLQSWTGTAPSIRSGGDATNIDLALVPKGTGRLDLQGTTQATAGAVAAYLIVKINGVDRVIPTHALS